MGSRVSVSLNNLVSNPAVSVRLVSLPVVRGEPFHKEHNPLQDVAEVDFYRIDDAMNRELIHSCEFDVSPSFKGNSFELEADFNILRGAESTVKLQRAFFECSIPHHVIPG